jgi:hypothetical protein
LPMVCAAAAPCVTFHIFTALSQPPVNTVTLSYSTARIGVRRNRKRQRDIGARW